MPVNHSVCVVALGVIALGQLSCRNLDEPVSPTKSQLAVHAILDVGDDLQQIFIYRTLAGLPTATNASRDEPVRAASVTLTAPNGGTITGFESTSDQFYNPVPGLYLFKPTDFGAGLVEGGTYTLHIRTSFGEEVTGTTTIPSPLSELRVALRVFVRARDTLRLDWPQASGARGYELVLGTGKVVWYRTFADSSVTLPGTMLTIDGNPVFAGGQAQAIVDAVDDNYYEYYRAQSDPFAGVPPSRLVGAVGVFGSVVPIIVADLLVR